MPLKVWLLFPGSREPRGVLDQGVVWLEQDLSNNNLAVGTGWGHGEEMESRETR